MALGLCIFRALGLRISAHIWAGIRSLAASARLGHTVAKVHTACSTSPHDDGPQIKHSGVVEQVARHSTLGIEIRFMLVSIVRRKRKDEQQGSSCGGTSSSS